MQELVKIVAENGSVRFEYYYDGVLCLVQTETFTAPVEAITAANADEVEAGLKAILGIA